MSRWACCSEWSGADCQEASAQQRFFRSRWGLPSELGLALAPSFPLGNACLVFTQVPVFLLFLDCVWQLVHQHPPAFEFTETYLTVLSDSLYIPIFSTFFFNSPHQKETNLVRVPLRNCVWQKLPHKEIARRSMINMKRL